MTPGSSAPENSSFPVFALCQSNILPTNGDINVTLALAHATA